MNRTAVATTASCSATLWISLIQRATGAEMARFSMEAALAIAYSPYHISIRNSLNPNQDKLTRESKSSSNEESREGTHIDYYLKDCLMMKKKKRATICLVFILSFTLCQSIK